MKGLQIDNGRAAGIDVGSESLHTSIAGETPHVFGTMTADLYALCDHFDSAWLSCKALSCSAARQSCGRFSFVADTTTCVTQ